MAIRILHIVTYMGRGGLETMLMNYYRHIDRNKVQFDFLVHRDFEADYDKEIEELGGKIYHISRLIPWSKAYKKELKKFFKEHSEYKIVHVHQDCLSSVALKCAQGCGIPVRIAHSHNSNQDKNWKYIIKKHYMKQIPRYATELMACGKDAGDWMFCGKPYHILHNAIDIKQYVIQEETKDNGVDFQNNIVIGNVGRFNVQKNHKFLIDVFYECVKRNPNAKLLLVGDGDGRKEIEEKVISLGIQNAVEFLGIRSDVNQLMRRMDVFVFPSLYEGLPVTMIEAQAAGLPCVISDHVSEECIVTKNRVSVMKLTDSAEKWAEHLLERAKEKKIDTTEEIIENGYDICSAAKKLERYYIDKFGEV